MTNYQATVMFRVYGLSEEYEAELHDLIDRLAEIPTKKVWDEVEWVVTELDN